MHLDQKIRAADLAALVGYTEYYLTHKFKEETGLSVTDYAKFAKIEHAKVLLKSTDLSVQDIAASLSFSTRNYFSRIFQEVTGQTPMEYRGGWFYTTKKASAEDNSVDAFLWRRTMY